jgi:hypothetical protein
VRLPIGQADLAAHIVLKALPVPRLAMVILDDEIGAAVREFERATAVALLATGQGEIDATAPNLAVRQRPRDGVEARHCDRGRAVVSR